MGREETIDEEQGEKLGMAAKEWGKLGDKKAAEMEKARRFKK